MSLLRGKVAIISGLGPGLGQQLAFAFAEHGAGVVLAARTKAYLKEITEKLEANGADVSYLVTDITDRNACENLVAHALDRGGAIHALVHNAYNPYPFARFEDADLADWRQNMEVNLFGALNLTQAALPAMKRQREGSIVFINSLISKQPYAMQGGYATSKGALSSAARMLALELGGHNIRVNSLYFGWMWGPPVENYLRNSAIERGVPFEVVLGEVTSQMALGRIPGDRECANAAVFLASDLASAITGAGIDVNAGELMS